MKSLIGTCLILLATSSFAAAQQWSPVEKEVLAQVQECFDSWTEATAQNDVDIWMQRCRPSGESLYWWAPNAGPTNLDGLLRRWNLYFPTVRRSTSLGFQPMRIRLVDNMALVYGYTWWLEEKDDGSLEESHDKRLEIYRKQDGTWGLVSIVWIPVPLDAE